MKSRAKQVLGKSVDAIVAAIEVYNKPTFSYREESFAILAINAWELLLKARILQIDGNRVAALIDHERRRLKNGKMSEKLYRKRNRSGNYVAIGLFKAFDRLVNDYGARIDPRVRNNLEALTEIRDNAVHFLNKGFDLRKKVHEIGTASLKNYLVLARQWFGVDLNDYQLFLLPIAFLGELPQGVALLSKNREERKVLEFIKTLEDSEPDGVSDFSLMLDLDIRIRRTKDATAPSVRISDSPDATPITIQEEDIREQFPWDYNILTSRLLSRYTDFVRNQEYHRIRKQLEKNPKLCRTRYLDPANQNGSQKRFYNPNIIAEFDKHYKRPTTASRRRRKRRA
jgi:hypothetical protein